MSNIIVGKQTKLLLDLRSFRLHPIGTTENSRSLDSLSLMSVGSMPLPTVNGLLNGHPPKRNGRKPQGAVSSKRSTLGAMNLPKDVRILVKSTVCRCRWEAFLRTDLAYTIVQAAFGSGATIGTNPIITPLVLYEIRLALKRVGRVCCVAVLGTINASKSGLRTGVGSASSLTRRIPGFAEYGINLSCRLLPQCRQIIPTALKAEIALPTDPLNLPTAFRAVYYRCG